MDGVSEALLWIGMDGLLTRSMWKSLRGIGGIGKVSGNLKEFYLVFSGVWIRNSSQQGDQAKELEDEIRLRVLGSLAVKP
jgi:hypothetical protein